MLEEKLKDFGSEGEAYKKKSTDMKFLTEIENKIKENQSLNKDELLFLYEIKSPIEGFGYEKDPRIDEIKKTRNPKEDAPIVFKCQPEQIAWKAEDVDENTKAYIGPLFEGIFYRNIKHIYNSFPERKIEEYDIKIGGKTKDQLIKELQEKNLVEEDDVDSVKEIIENQNFNISKNTEIIKLIKIDIRPVAK